MRKILFVDDEPFVLSALQRTLRKMQSEWEIHFASSGAEALEIMKSKDFDVVVSDMRMPEMNGAQLLTKIKDAYPSVERLILSGHSDPDLIVQSILCAHQYMAKPCDSDTLISSIQRSMALRDLLANKDVQRTIAAMPALPVLPVSYSKLTKLLHEECVSFDEVAQIVAADVGLASKMLHLVNSSFFGSGSQVSNPARAVSLLGVDIVKSLMLVTGLFDQLKTAVVEGISLESIYTHCRAVGMTARGLAQQLGLDKKVAEEAFLAGVMHDIGRAILLAQLPDQFNEAVRMSRGSNISLRECEQKIFGATHAEMGAYLLALWGERESIVEAVAFHHSPRSANDVSVNVLAMVHVAEGMNWSTDCDGETSAGPAIVDESYLKVLGLDQKAAELTKTPT